MKGKSCSLRFAVVSRIKNNINFSFFVIFLLQFVLSVPLAYSSDPDIAYFQNDVFEIKEKKHQYELKSDTEIKQIFLSRRSTDEKMFFIYEKNHTNVKKIKTKFIKAYKPGYIQATAFNSFYSDEKVHFIEFKEEINSGDSIYYQYSQTYDDIVYMPIIYIPNHDYLAGYKATFEHPVDVEVNFEFFFSRDSIPIKIEKSDPKTTVLSVDSIPYAIPLPLFAYNDNHAEILVTFKHGDSTLNKTSIPEFIEWYGQKVNLDPKIPDSIAADVIDSLSMRKTNIDKLSYIQQYITDNFRFLDDSRLDHNYFPYPPESTLAYKYGDCKDRSYLACALANTCGIKLNMALLQTNYPVQFKGMHLYNFDHTICVYDSGDSLIFFDPIVEYCPVGEIPDGYQYGPVFIVDPINPRYEEFGHSDMSSPSVDISIKGSADSLHDCEASIKVTGSKYRTIRHMLEDLTESKAELALKDYFNPRLKNIEFSDFELVEKNNTSLTLSATSDLVKCIIQADQKIYIPRIPFALIDNKIIHRADDSYPIFPGPPNNIRLDIRIKAFPGLPVVDSLSVHRDDVARLVSFVDIDSEGNLNFTAAYNRTKILFENDSRQEFIDFCRDFLNSNNDMYITKRKGI